MHKLQFLHRFLSEKFEIEVYDILYNKKLCLNQMKVKHGDYNRFMIDINGFHIKKSFQSESISL